MTLTHSERKLQMRAVLRAFGASRRGGSWLRQFSTDARHSAHSVDFKPAFAVRNAPSGKGRGLFATRRISAGQEIVSENPIASGQIFLNRNFEMVCDNCLRHLKADEENITEYLPESKPFLPGPYIPPTGSVLSYKMFGRVYHYCSSECFGHAWENFHTAFEIENVQLSDAEDNEEISREEVEAIKQRRKKLNSGQLVNKVEDLYNDWDEVLPPLPLDAILKLFAKEIILSNPTLKYFPAAKQLTPKRRLKVLEPLRSINSALFPELVPLVKQVTRVLNEILLGPSPRLCRFEITEELVDDTIRRFLANHQYIVMKSPKSIHEYLKWAADSPYVQKIIELEQSLSAQRLDIAAVWHPVGGAVYETHCIANHSCDPNASASTLQSETHKLTISAQRNIEEGEEITISYLRDLDLPTAERKQLLKEEFAFDCKCHRCQQGN